MIICSQLWFHLFRLPTLFRLPDVFQRFAMSRQLDRFAQIHADLFVQSDGCLRPFRPLLGPFNHPRNVGARLLIPAANWVVFCFLFPLFRLFRLHWLLLDRRPTPQLDNWFDIMAGSECFSCGGVCVPETGGDEGDLRERLATWRMWEFWV